MSKLFECYVANPTHDEAVEIVERLIANGAEVFDVVEGMGIDYNGFKCANDDYDYWGYRSSCGTYADNKSSEWANRSKQLTMQEFRAAFPCDKYDSVVDDNEEWPQPLDEVVVDCYGKWDAIFIGKSQSGACVCEMPEEYEHGVYDSFAKGLLSKPKSDREKFVELASEVNRKLAIGASESDMLNALYDAGFKAPEEK